MPPRIPRQERQGKTLRCIGQSLIGFFFGIAGAYNGLTRWARAGTVFSVKPLRVLKPNPKDPEWTFPYASRERVTKLRKYFLALPNRPRNWNTQHAKCILSNKERATLEPWAQVPVQHRDRVDAWFKMKVAQLPAHKRTAGKIRSLRGNAVCYGRWVLTRKRHFNKMWYDLNKRIWLAFQEWEAKEIAREQRASLPPTARKMLEVV